MQLLVAEFWANWLGIQLNHNKKELPISATRHLGFFIDLRRKAVSIIRKHKRKMAVYFDNFLVAARKRGRISARVIQRMLGLQIWISTVFRVARQFLTSMCDILKITGKIGFFYPRKHPQLVGRAVRDLAFWRRFVMGTAEAGFNYLLDRLPVNRHRLSSNASTSFGMSGVLRFAQIQTINNFKTDGLFWQIK